MDFFLLIIIGLGVGFISGMFGIGGAVLMTPILILLGYPDNIALATPLAGAIFSSLSGSVKYARAKLIDYRTGLIVVAASLSTSWIGVYISNLSTNLMILIKIIFMLSLALQMFLPEKEISGEKKHGIFIPLLIGAFTGIFSAMVAIGGGLLFLFAFLRILKLDIKRTIATSLFCVGILSFLNTVLHYRAGNVDLSVALPIVLGIIPAALSGSYAALHISGKLVKKLFGVILSLFAIFFIIYRLAG